MNKAFCISCLLLLSSSIVTNVASWELLGNDMWSERLGHVTVSLSTDEIVLMGGSNSDGIYKNDVWISNDKGLSWTQQTNNAWSSGRSGHAAVTLPNDTIIVMGGSNGAHRLNDVWMSSDSGESWTQLDDAEWDERNNYVAVVLPNDDIVVMGGNIGNGNQNDVWISTDSGQSWVLKTSNADWEARTSHAAVALSNGDIVVIGGYDFPDRLNDVWISIDSGENWDSLSNNIWSARDNHAAVALPTDEIVVMGGSLQNDVWISTTKGNSWIQQEIIGNMWSGRDDHAAVALSNGEIVVMGGLNGGYTSDVWISADEGKSWSERTSNAGWSGRYQHAAVALPNDHIVVLGGRDGSGGLNDVWISTNSGQSWSRQTNNAWSFGRYHHAAVVLSNGNIVVMGGWTSDEFPNRIKNDVWISQNDGETWSEQIITGDIWSARYRHTAVVLSNDDIVVMGGINTYGRSNDVWISKDSGETWEQLANADWDTRSGHAAVAMSTNEIVVMGGYTSNLENDIWISYDFVIPSPTPTPSNTPSITPTPSNSPTPSVTPSATSSVTPSITPSITSSVTPSPSPSALPSASPFVTNTQRELRSFETMETRADRVIVRRNGHNPRSVEMDREKGSIVVSTNSNAMNISLVSIEELTINGSILQTFLNDDSLRFSSMTQEVVDMGTAEAFRMAQTAIIEGQKPMPGAGARVTTEVYSFQTNGSFSYGTTELNVSQHDTKIIIRVEFWDFTVEGEHLRVTMKSQNNLFEPTQTTSEDGRDTTLVWGPHVIHLSDQTQTDDTFQVMFEHYPKINIEDRTMQFMLNRGQHMEFDPLFSEGDVETDYQLFQKAGEDHRGDPICPSGFEIRRQAEDVTLWMPGFDTTDDLPFCTRIYDTEQEICSGGTTFVTQATTEYDNVMYYGCAGLSTLCCAYPKPSNCGSGGHCPKPLNGGELCQVPWTNLCNNRGSCRDNQCVCEHGFEGDTCADAPACDSVTDYEEWIPASECYPLCGVKRQQTFKKIPNEDKYWCSTIIGQRECETEPLTVNCDSLTELTDLFWESVDFNSLNGFVGDSNEIDGDIVSFLLAQDVYAGRQVFVENNTITEAIVVFRNELGLLDLLAGNNVRDHLNQLHQFSGNESLGTNSLTQHLFHVVDTTGANVHDNVLRDLIGVSVETIVYPDDVKENLVQTIWEIAERLGDSPKEEFGDIDTLRTLLLLNQTKVNQYKSDMCDYYETPLRPRGCTGHCGYGSRTIRWVPKPGQPSYCTVIHEEEECTVQRTCPVYEGGDESVALGDASCQYSDWTKWSECQTSGQKGDVQGWQGRSRDRIMGHKDQCVDTFEYRPCDVMTGKRLATTRNLFLQHTAQAYRSSGENVVIMSVVLLSLSVILGFVLVPKVWPQWSNQLHLQ